MSIVHFPKIFLSQNKPSKAKKKRQQKKPQRSKLVRKLMNNGMARTEITTPPTSRCKSDAKTIVSYRNVFMYVTLMV